MKMARYFLRLNEDYFDSSVIFDRDKEGLRKVADESNEKPFSEFRQLENCVLSYNAHIGKKPEEIPNLIIHTIPFTINKLPVLYEHPAGNLWIGNIEFDKEER